MAFANGGISVEKLQKLKKRSFEIIQVGEKKDFISRSFDFILIFLIAINVIIMIAETYEISDNILRVFNRIEKISVIAFTVEYLFRLWTSDLLYPSKNKIQSMRHFALSTFGIIDLLAILPFYLPVVFPTGFLGLRALRAVRILRLFRINKYYDSLSVIGGVVKNKKNQLLSSLFIIIIMLLTSALIMYNVEHHAQPDVFENAFTSIWFVVSNISTIGYGDIYPITFIGRLLSIIITFLGIGLIAIPTGIISAGFIEQVAEAKMMDTFGNNNHKNLEKQYCPYCGKKLD